MLFLFRSNVDKVRVTSFFLTGEAAAVDAEVAGAWLTTGLPTLLERYGPDDVYNADETGVFFQMLPSKTLTFKGDKCSGGKQSKVRVTVMLLANMSGSDKQKLLIIGKSQKPRCFKNVNIDHLGVTYRWNSKAWMTGELFNEWVRKFDLVMRSARRQVLLLLDNCSAHQLTFHPSNVEIRFLPPNTTASLQPMDQGIIQNLKVHYRGLVLRRYIAEVEAGTNSSYRINLLDAIRYLVRAWDMVTQTTIANCFRKAGFHVSEAAEDGAEELNEVEEVYDGLFDRLRAFMKIPENINFSDFVAADEEVVARSVFTEEEIAVTAAASSPSAADVNSDVEEDETETTVLPIARNAAEAYRMLGQIRGFLETKADNLDRHALDCVDRMIGSVVEKRTVQSRIDSFFSR